ncbi:hypothetical protein FBU30_005989 [Linnemannia zychae]|nr:hypothetical protein FBU30_005989 [Linnemannia zychae]
MTPIYLNEVLVDGHNSSGDVGDKLNDSFLQDDHSSTKAAISSGHESKLTDDDDHHPPPPSIQNNSDNLVTLSSHRFHHSQHVSHILQLPPVIISPQQLSGDQQRFGDDMEDNAIARHQYSHDERGRIDFITESKLEVERRRHFYSPMKHLYPPFPSVAKATTTSGSLQYRHHPIPSLLPIDDQYIYAKRNYTSPTYLEDYVLTHRGSIHNRHWTTFLFPRKAILPYETAMEVQHCRHRAAATTTHQKRLFGSILKKKKRKWPESNSLSTTLEMKEQKGPWLPALSPGHHIHPATPPGSIYGIHRPRFTHRHALYDVPFYGIENVEISSSRYQLLMKSKSTEDKDQKSRDDDGHIQRCEVEDEGDESKGMKQSERSDSHDLSDHREHIWSIAHEDEYSSDSIGIKGINKTGKDNEDRLAQGRFKITQRIFPTICPVAVVGSTSGSGSVEVPRQDGNNRREEKEEEEDDDEEEEKRREGGGRSQESRDQSKIVKSTETETEMVTEARGESPVKMIEMGTIYSLASLRSATTTATTNHLLPTMDGRYHGHGDRHGSHKSRRPYPVSQRIYGPDSFQEALDNPKLYHVERLTGWNSKLLATIQRHWKTWICIGLILAVVIVVPVMLNKKKLSLSKETFVSSMGQGGGD